MSEVTTLSIIAESKPHAVFAGFTHGVSASWNYFARVTNITSLSLNSDPLLLLETVICKNLISQLTGFVISVTPFISYCPFPFGSVV